MAKRSRKYCYPDTDRHGNRRWYFKPPGWGKVRIQEAEGTRAFNAEYKRLFDAWREGGQPEKPQKVIARETLAWLFNQYQASKTFHDLAENTKIQRRNMMKRTAKVYGDKPLRAMRPESFVAIRDAFDSPGAARNWIKAMRAVYKWAASTEVGLVSENPTLSISIPRTPNKGAERWTLEEVKQYLDHHDDGPARMCMVILLCTGQRISDVRTMGMTNVQNGWISVVQKKTKNRVRFPVLPMLRQELGPTFLDLVWLKSAYGAPYSEKSLSQRFSTWARDAGVPKTAHGVRKAVGTLLAEAGLSEDTVMAILGHETSEEARKYIQNANRDRLASEAMDVLGRQFRGLG